MRDSGSDGESSAGSESSERADGSVDSVETRVNLERAINAVQGLIISAQLHKGVSQLPVSAVMQRIEFEGKTGVLLGRWQVAVEVREQGPLIVGLGEVGVLDQDAMEQQHGFVAVVFVY